MFRKRSQIKAKETGTKSDKPHYSLKYEKPKILLIDMPGEAADNLLKQGYNVSVGSFGNPYKVPLSDSYQPVICNGKLPNVTEQEIVFVDLEQPEILKEPQGEKRTSEAKDDCWASCNHGVIDPRPLTMLTAGKHFDRILSHGGLFVIFAKERELQKGSLRVTSFFTTYLSA